MLLVLLKRCTYICSYTYTWCVCMCHVCASYVCHGMHSDHVFAYAWYNTRLLWHVCAWLHAWAAVCTATCVGICAHDSTHALWYALQHVCSCLFDTSTHSITYLCIHGVTYACFMWHIYVRCMSVLLMCMCTDWHVHRTICSTSVCLPGHGHKYVPWPQSAWYLNHIGAGVCPWQQICLAR